METAQQFCPQCGKETDLDARFCKYCAFALAPNTIQKPAQSNTLLILGGFALVIIVILVLFFYSRTTDQAKRGNETAISQPSPSPSAQGGSTPDKTSSKPAAPAPASPPAQSKRERSLERDDRNGPQKSVRPTTAKRKNGFRRRY